MASCGSYVVLIFSGQKMQYRLLGVLSLSLHKQAAGNAYAGFEKDREALKYRCPARCYGLEFAGMAECNVKNRSSNKWEKLYKKRTEIPRDIMR